jgi:hypothetical protein
MRQRRESSALRLAWLVFQLRMVEDHSFNHGNLMSWNRSSLQNFYNKCDEAEPNPP